LPQYRLDDNSRSGTYYAVAGGDVFVPFSRQLSSTDYVLEITKCDNGTTTIGYSSIGKLQGGFWIYGLEEAATIEYFAVLYN
jgi:hypothetical protein